MFSYSRRSFLKSTAASAITLGFSGAAPRLAFAAPDLARLDGLAQAELVRKREITALELVDAAIQRRRRKSETQRRRDISLRPRAQGGPETAVRRGLRGRSEPRQGPQRSERNPQHLGSRLYADNYSTRTEPLLAAYEQAGIIFVGKSKLPSWLASHHRAAAARPLPTIPGTSTIRPAARRAARRRRSRPAWFLSLTPMTSAARSAFPRPVAASSA